MRKILSREGGESQECPEGTAELSTSDMVNWRKKEFWFFLREKYQTLFLVPYNGIRGGSVKERFLSANRHKKEMGDAFSLPVLGKGILVPLVLA